jgi:hypothetical protein
MNIDKLKKGYNNYCKSKSHDGYIWGSYASDVFDYLRSSEFKNLNLHDVLVRFANYLDRTGTCVHGDIDDFIEEDSKMHTNFCTKTN